MSATVPATVASGQAAERRQIEVLRAIAALELGKGLIVLLAGCGVLLLVHRDATEVAEGLLRLLHISPDRHFAHRFLNWTDRLTAAKLWAVAAAAIVYSCLRFVEAYGLWRARAWAEWIALVSGAVYLPIEVFEVHRNLNLFHVAVLAVNLAVVLYMAYLRMSARTQPTSSEQA